MHRDVKASNIMFLDTKHEIIKLIDFDFAINFKKNENIQNKHMTGTPNYLAPEIIKKGISNEKSDIWAVGITLFYLMTQNKPFEGKDVNELYKNITAFNINHYMSFFFFFK